MAKITLADLRQSRNVTQAQLARQTNIDRITISRYENGHVDMSLTNAKKIADALNCTVDDLLKKEDE